MQSNASWMTTMSVLEALTASQTHGGAKNSSQDLPEDSGSTHEHPQTPAIGKDAVGARKRTREALASTQNTPRGTESFPKAADTPSAGGA